MGGVGWGCLCGMVTVPGFFVLRRGVGGGREFVLLFFSLLFVCFRFCVREVEGKLLAMFRVCVRRW